MTFTYNSSVTVANPNATPVLTKHADNIQLDALGRLKTSSLLSSEWYNSTIDKDSDLRLAEQGTAFVITTTANGTQTASTINVGNSSGIYPGAIFTDGVGVPVNPLTIVTAVPSGTSVTLNQSVTVQNGATLTFNNANRTTTATGGQTGVTSLVVAQTTGLYVGDLVTNQNTANPFPINTWVVSITNGTTVVLSQAVTVSNADVINFQHATSWFNQATSDVTMTSGPSIDGRIIRQSRVKHKITPGVSQAVYQSVNFNGSDPNVTKRFGFYNEANGMFWELDTSGNLNVVVRRTLPNGTIVEDRVTRSSFNTDKLDGTGPSGYDITASTTVSITGFSSITAATVGFNVVWNVTSGHGTDISVGTTVVITGITPTTYNGAGVVVANSTNTITVYYDYNPGTYSSGGGSGATLYTSGFHKEFTWWIEFIGGRTGRVRFGFGSTIGPDIVHTFSYGGVLGINYISATALPIRFEIINSGTQSYISTMRNAGFVYNIESTGSTSPSIASATNNAGFAADSTLRPILGFSLRAGAPYSYADLLLKTFDMIDKANNLNNSNRAVLYWALIFNPTISGTLPSGVNCGKASQYFAYTTANAITAGTGYTVFSGYNFSQLPLNNTVTTDFLNMGTDVSGNIPDQLVLCVQLLTAGTATNSMVATMNWIELL